MSTKIYGGRRRIFPDGFSLEVWQNDLFAARDKLHTRSQDEVQKLYERLVFRYFDAKTVFPNDATDEKSPLGKAYSVVDEMIERNKKGIREPFIDKECSLSWRLLPDGKTVLVIIYAEHEMTSLAEELLHLEDFHYQNQTGPEGCTWEEMEARGAVWGEALGGFRNPPTHRFHTFEISPPPSYIVPREEGPKPPSFDERVRETAEDVAFRRFMGSSEGPRSGGTGRWRDVEAFTKMIKPGGERHEEFQAVTIEVENLLVRNPTLDQLRMK